MKKKYHVPEIKAFGNLVELTRTVISEKGKNNEPVNDMGDLEGKKKTS